MKNLSGIITAIIIIVFLGFLAMHNCDCLNSKCSAESVNTETTSTDACGEDCKKACCLGCHATKGDVVCLDDHSCCAAKLLIEEKECCDGTEQNCCQGEGGHSHEAGEGHDHSHEAKECCDGADPDCCQGEGHDHNH